MKKDDVNHVLFLRVDHHKSGGEHIWLSFQQVLKFLTIYR